MIALRDSFHDSYIILKVAIIGFLSLLDLADEEVLVILVDLQLVGRVMLRIAHPVNLIRNWFDVLFDCMCLGPMLNRNLQS